jgi:hypothetical protein
LREHLITLSISARLQEQGLNADPEPARLDDFCGRVVTIVGTYTRRVGATVIREVIGVRP